MSVQKNFMWSSILTVSGYFFPLLTFPYVSRVLGVTNIGICNYVDSIITYFCVFSAMGVAVVGVREIASVSDQEERRSNTFISILLLNALFTLISIIILLICITYISKFQEYKTLFYIGLLKLVSNLFLVEWFYKGIEDFSYITKRAIIVKSLYVISIFIFVRQQDDYIIYFTLTILHICINALVNLMHLKSHLRIRKLSISFSPYIKSYVIMGIYTILTTMYTTFNVAILGYISGPKEVGFFTTSTKVLSIILALFTAFTNVMLPRMSSLQSNHEDEKFIAMIGKSMNVLFMFAFPLVVYFFIFSPDVIGLIAGKGYEGAITPFRIIIPSILVIGYEQIIIIQALMPMKKDNVILVNSCIGASIGLILNFVLIPYYGSVGTSVAYCLCEFSVLCSALFFFRKYTKYHIPMKELLQHSVLNLPVVAICMLVCLFVSSGILRLIIAGILIGAYVYMNNYFVMKNTLFIQIVEKAKIELWNRIPKSK